MSKGVKCINAMFLRQFLFIAFLKIYWQAEFVFLAAGCLHNTAIGWYIYSQELENRGRGKAESCSKMPQKYLGRFENNTNVEVNFVFAVFRFLSSYLCTSVFEYFFGWFSFPSQSFSFFTFLYSLSTDLILHFRKKPCRQWIALDDPMLALEP
jgi:hypothetical protein